MEIEENGIKISKSDNTFYNPSQKLNREISSLLLSTLSDKKLKILECMSATGLRGIYYFKNINPESELTLNDISEDAYLEIKKNLETNSIKFISGCELRNSKSELKNLTKNSSENSKPKCILENMDCRILMLKNKYDIIDIDPFGSPVSFLSSAFESIKHNGILFITATDTAVLCGNRRKCFFKYSILTMKTQSFNELAIRTLLGSIQNEASKHGYTIEPILSVSIDFYIRVFVRVKRKLENKLNFYKICYCLFNKELIPTFRENNTKKSELLNIKPEENHKKYNYRNNDYCIYCKNKIKICGPYFDGPIHDKKIIEEMIMKTKNKKIIGFLNVIKNELNTFCAYNLSYFSKILGIDSLPMKKIMSIILNNRFDVSLIHSHMNFIKTNMPFEMILGIMKNFKDVEIRQEIKEIFENCKFRGYLKKGTGPLKKTR